MYFFLDSCSEYNREFTPVRYIVCHQNVGIMITGYLIAKIQAETGSLCFADSLIANTVKLIKYFFLFYVSNFCLDRPFGFSIQDQLSPDLRR